MVGPAGHTEVFFLAGHLQIKHFILKIGKGSGRIRCFLLTCATFHYPEGRKQNTGSPVAQM